MRPPMDLRAAALASCWLTRVPTRKGVIHFRSKAPHSAAPGAPFKGWEALRFLVSRSWNATRRRSARRQENRIRCVCSVAAWPARAARSDRPAPPSPGTQASASVCWMCDGSATVSATFFGRRRQAVRDRRRIDVSQRQCEGVLEQRLGFDQLSFDEAGGVEARV
jgi:hypothetical protein